MCVAIAVVAGIAAAGTITAAKMQSGAAQNASKTTAEAADKALAFQKEQYQQERTDFNPYQTAGASALGRMSTQAAAPVQGFRQPPPPAQLGTPIAKAPTLPGQPMGGAPMPMGAPAPLGGTAPTAPTAPGPMVLMRGPDGAQRQVPTQVAQQLQTRGFTVVAHG